MIPISTFNLLVVIGILLVIYAVIDNRNRLYANIPSAFLAALMFAFLGSAISTDAVYESIGGVATAVNSPSVGYVMYFIAVIMFVYTLLMVYDVLMETLAKKSELVKAGEGE